ncbi:MAG TPA: acyltransferase family protein [Hyphomicrobiales bacterium]|nr:acyltransferase family protein [Hyphomicrobiales bacterium]
MLSYRPEIDGLRAIAIVSVVLFHAGGKAFGGGYVGVDIFFVISGFLITSLILKAQREGGFSYRDFYARRARRILPALLFMVTVVTAAAFAVLLPADLVDYGKMLIYTLLFGANFRLTATPAYFDTASQDNPLLHMWSLAVEEQFYVLWPALLLALLAVLAPKRLRLAVLVIAFASLIASEILVRGWPKTAFYQLYARGWELLAGAVLAMGLVPAIRLRALAEALSLLGLAFMIAPVFLYDRETAFPGLAALPPVLGCAFVIHAENSVRTRIGAFLSLRPIVFIGLISYSLYLWHWPVFAFPSYVLMRETTLAESAGLVIIAAILAAFSWRFVEKPFRKRPAATREDRQPPRRLPLTRGAYCALALTAGLCASGSYFQESKGAEWRLPKEVVALSRMTIETAYLDCAKATELGKDFVACEMGRSIAAGEKPEAVLWGDSHAMHYERLIAAVYGSGLAYIHNDCMPILGVYVVFKEIRRGDEGCIKNKERVFRELLASRPRVVILAGRWTYSEPLPYGLEIRTTRYFLRSDEDPRELNHSRQVFAQELVNTVTKLTGAGIRVVLMGQVPELQIPVSHCLAISRYLNRDGTRCLGIRRDEVERRQANVNRLLRAIEATNPLVTVFWPMASMCEDGWCHAARDGKIFYRDNNHLTPEGALSLVEAFKTTVSNEFLTGSQTREQVFNARIAPLNSLP